MQYWIVYGQQNGDKLLAKEEKTITLQLILHKLKTNMDVVQHERLNQTIFEQVDHQQEKILVLNVELDTIKMM